MTALPRLVVRITALALLLGLGIRCRAQDGSIQWLQTLQSPAQGTARSAALVLDSQDNIYVAGSVTTASHGLDLALAKYDSLGDLLWVATYDGPVSGNDWATSATIDTDDYIDVTGVSDGRSSHRDLVTLRFDPTGRQLWVRRYNDPSNGDDGGAIVRTDPFNDVYIAGWNWGGVKSGYDFVVMKYSVQGDCKWVHIYNGPAAGNDIPTAMAVDAAGYAYVTGYSWGGLSRSFDFATLKYSPTGALLWSRRYNGPGSDQDLPVSIAVDGKGDVFVSGTSVGVAHNGKTTDIATLKYDRKGSLLWTQRVAGGVGVNLDCQAAGLALDQDGNVYVGGYVGAGIDADANWLGAALAVSYDPTGKTLWTGAYSPSADGYMAPTAMTVDTMGNVYMTGSQQNYAAGDTSLNLTTCKIAFTGQTVWTTPAVSHGYLAGNGTAITLDSADNIIVSGTVQTGWDNFGLPIEVWATLCYSQ